MVDRDALLTVIAQCERDAQAELDEAGRWALTATNAYGDEAQFNAQAHHRTLAQVHHWYLGQLKSLLAGSVSSATAAAGTMIRHRSGCSAWATDHPQEWRAGDEARCDCGAKELAVSREEAEVQSRTAASIAADMELGVLDHLARFVALEEAEGRSALPVASDLRAKIREFLARPEIADNVFSRSEALALLREAAATRGEP